MKGEVWTVFQGAKSESFAVEVTGVIQNALGPGKSMILCRLTDERVQNMGAVAGMSGSPLYIDGRLAGALSYQVQRFETVRYAGFTPIEDLLEVRKIALNTVPRRGHGGQERHPTLPASSQPADPAPAPAGDVPSGVSTAQQSPSARAGVFSPSADPLAAGLQPLTPVFALGGISPQVASLFSDRFQAVGLNVTALGGNTLAGTEAAATAVRDVELKPGDAVAAALSVGDITLAGTGTVSHVDGDRVLAFGHPLMGLGAVAVPMAAADIVAILPSNLNSFKISNTGRVIGTVRQDRLSAIYGELGEGPELVPVTVKTPTRTLHFSTVRHPRLTPVIAAAGLTQAVLGSNDAGLTEGFRVASEVTFPDGKKLANTSVYPGPQGFNSGLDSFIRRLGTWVDNPVEEVFPSEIVFSVEPLDENPMSSLDNVQVSRRTALPGEPVTITLTVRDYQGAPVRETLTLDIPANWAGKSLDIVVTTGASLDKLTGLPDSFPVAQIRSFDAYLDALRHERLTDGLYVAVLERTSSFTDQTTATLDLPGSLERVARTADEARFQRRDVSVPLWERHVFPGRILPAGVRRPLTIAE
ncbi:MAG TPA: SpoIVB peptidase S55 domain-containing protein [Opitutaceae bacterium]